VTNDCQVCTEKLTPYNVM